jgi:succinate dehydrogenase / fumarate reductase cytochrome b subunit
MSQAPLAITDTTLGKKYVMALSGLVLFGFVIAHMLGNLQVLIGPKAMNEYAHMMQSNPTVLWGARIVLLSAIVLHFGTAFALTAQNKKARPVKYKVKKDVATSYAAKSMIYGGIVILAYIIFHLMHFTITPAAQTIAAKVGYVHSAPFGTEQIPNVYNNVIQSFQNTWVTLVYLVAQIALGLHLYHGAWSITQSLGLTHQRYNDTLRSVAVAFAFVVVIGFSAVPIAVKLGLVGTI